MRSKLGLRVLGAVAEEFEAEMEASAPMLSQEDRGSRPAAGEATILREITHIDMVRVIERLHRRSLDLVRADLIQARVDDLSPSQVMMLFTIGSGELSVRELIERGYYLGTNASYSLKRLVEADYVIRTPSERDRRSARVRLSEKGRRLCEWIKSMERPYHQRVARNEDDLRDIETTYRTLRRMEQAWSNAVRYRDETAEE